MHSTMPCVCMAGEWGAGRVGWGIYKDSNQNHKLCTELPVFVSVQRQLIWVHVTFFSFVVFLLTHLWSHLLIEMNYYEAAVLVKAERKGRALKEEVEQP